MEWKIPERQTLAWPVVVEPITRIVENFEIIYHNNEIVEFVYD
jgi:hypothetical protein